jgi:hypothetical protein
MYKSDCVDIRLYKSEGADLKLEHLAGQACQDQGCQQGPYQLVCFGAARTTTASKQQNHGDWYDPGDSERRPAWHRIAVLWVARLVNDFL